jgi:tetratricopeptide (TPR) repeat protein
MIQSRLPALPLAWMLRVAGPAMGGIGMSSLGISGMGCAASPAPQHPNAAPSPAKPSAAPLPDAPAAPAAPAETGLASAERAYDESRYADAEAAYRRLLDGGDAAAARRGLSRVLLITGRDAEAASVLEGALAADPADDDAVTTLAESAWLTGNSARALSLLQGISDHPEARRARLLLGEVLLDLGRRADAEVQLMTLIEDYNEDRIGVDDGLGLAMVGRAAHLLRSPHDANDAFNAAERASPSNVPILLWRAELFLEKHDPGHAEEVVGEALERAPNHPRALVWMAHVKLEQALDFDAARSLCERALAINPRLTHAYFVLAGLALRDLEFQPALDLIGRGLAVDPENLELLGMRAAVAFLAENTALFEETRAKVFAKNPSYSRFYSIIGEYAEWEHRYDRIVEMMREAVAIDDQDAEAHAALGMNLIRAGQELGGVQSLRRAAAKDPFNVRVYNTLNLFEQIIPEGYVSRKQGRFSIRYPKGEAALLERYVPALLDRAYAKFSKAYGFTPSEPIGIELYELREHFAVRTSGLPQTAILGVCFGKTLAALTPKSEPFNLGMTLWHELAHVFHIQMSDSHVPRWLTEGLAEYETLAERKEWRRHQDPDLFIAERMGRLPAVGGMNRAFSHAEHMQDMATAYYASSQIAVMLVERFGREKLNRALRLQARGMSTNAALEAALGEGVDALDRDFASFREKTLARYRSQFVPLEARGDLDELDKRAQEAPGDATAKLRVVLVALRQRDLERAKRVWADAAKLDPKSADVRYLGARLSAAAGQDGLARAELVALARDGHDGYAVQMSLAELTDPEKDAAGLRAALQKAHTHDPTQSAPLSGLLSLAVKAGDRAGELSVLEQLALLDAHDPGVYRRLLELLIEQKAYARAVQHGEAAIYADIEGSKTHALYAEALAGVGRFDDAAFEFQSAVHAPSRPEDVAAAHVAYARFLQGRGQSERAAKELERAREINPDAGASPAPANP